MHFTIDLRTCELRRNGSRKGSNRAPNLIDGGEYQVVTEMASAKDGVSVPITLVSKRCNREGRGSVPDPGPFLLIGYGAYGLPLTVEYDPQVMALLQRGFSVGYAHCRGGGEYGSHWHAAGKGMLKWNTFNDFAACAEHLISKRYTSPSLLCGMGTSAGGLIMGVMANEFPHLFAALIMR
jgi:oligopeptidase B